MIEQPLTLSKDRNSLDTMPVKIHNTMARTLARFEEPEYAKLFLISLGKLLQSDNHIAHINKMELFDKLNITDEQRHTRYFNMLNEMRKRTEYDITIDGDTQLAGNIVYRVKRTRNEYQVAFDEDMAPILKELKNHYTLMYVDSVLSLSSSHSITLYNYLLSWYNSKHIINRRWFTTKDLKELFGLSKDDYMRKDGTFDRYNFEKYTIQTAVKEIGEAGFMTIRWHKAKDKLTKKISAYIFEFVVNEGTVPTSEDGLEFTEFKYGKTDDIIISDVSELEVE